MFYARILKKLTYKQAKSKTESLSSKQSNVKIFKQYYKILVVCSKVPFEWYAFLYKYPNLRSILSITNEVRSSRL